ncbi:MAG: ATP-grasp domain-containing protein [Candidatus Eremiobacteraeota bacterium]|nr:ATP-grasp domain-containing protein [Candidatus Eremiobacteraeota bacterium]
MILVTDGLWRKSLGVVRSLGRVGFRVAVGEMTPVCCSFFSRYCSRRLLYPSPRTRPDSFIKYIRKKLETGDYRAIYPMEEETLLLLGRERNWITDLTLFPFAQNDSIEKVRDKGNLMELAREMDFPIPKTVIIDNAEELEERIDEIPIPAVIKPRVGSGGRGIEYVNEKSRLVSAYKKVEKNHDRPIIQEYIPGESYGVSCLGDGCGGMPAVFIHRRLRTYPVSGGSSTLAESTASPELVNLSEVLISVLRWFGVAMVEFRLDERDGRFKLIEMNPRFWGTVALSTACGVNFPELLYRLANEEEIKPVRKWKTGVRARWLFPGEILHFIKNRQAQKEWKTFFKKPGEKYIDLVADPADPFPLAGKILSIINFLVFPELFKIIKGA